MRKEKSLLFHESYQSKAQSHNIIQKTFHIIKHLQIHNQNYKIDFKI